MTRTLPADPVGEPDSLGATGSSYTGGTWAGASRTPIAATAGRPADARRHAQPPPKGSGSVRKGTTPDHTSGPSSNGNVERVWPVQSYSSRATMASMNISISESL